MDMEEKMTPELLAADIARRVPDMAMDSVINNEALISNLMQEYLQHIENRADFDRVAPFINWCDPHADKTSNPDRK